MLAHQQHRFIPLQSQRYSRQRRRLSNKPPTAVIVVKRFTVWQVRPARGANQNRCVWDIDCLSRDDWEHMSIVKIVVQADILCRSVHQRCPAWRHYMATTTSDIIRRRFIEFIASARFLTQQSLQLYQKFIDGCQVHTPCACEQFKTNRTRMNESAAVPCNTHVHDQIESKTINIYSLGRIKFISQSDLAN